MSPENSLPILLVSASDKKTAEEFISELIDNDVTEEVRAGGDGGSGEEGRVWRLVNKYYRADVCVRPLGDADALPAADEPRVEAHVIYFTPQECSAAEGADNAASVRAVEVAEERAARGGRGRGVRGGVRVAALGAAREAVALAGWAARARYEPLALGAGPAAAPAALGRAREALHAHVWPGLRRLDRPDCPMPLDLEWSSSEGSGAEEDGSSEDEAAGVERAEEFARALGALGGAGLGAAGAAGAGAGGVSDGERRARAEQLLAAFCRALGHDLQL